MANILVVDDSAVDRKLVGGLLDSNEQLTIAYASNGAEALDRLERVVPDLVVTDMNMPELDGLQLVTAVRANYPLVPVILVTAHGSEEVAVEALERGASSYVPKSQLAERLLETVEQVLALARAERSHEQLLDYLTQTHLTFELENDPSVVAPLVDHFQQILASMGICDATERIRVGVALEEALLNALYHGNLELSNDQLQEARSALMTGEGTELLDERPFQQPYADRRIHVRAEIDSQGANFWIRDEGPGFDVASIPNPEDPTSLEQQSGRGLVLLQTFMDEVEYNETGNEVRLLKRRATVDAEGSADENQS